MTPVFTLAVGSLSWAPPPLPLVVLGVVLVALVGSGRRSRQRLVSAPAWRRRGVLVLSAMAFVALAALLVPPTWERDATETVTLLTEGAEAVSAQGSTFVMGAVDLPADRRRESLRSVGQLLLRAPQVQRIDVQGHGLDALSWAQLPDDLAVTWQPPATPLAGPVAVQWPAVLEIGEPLSVHGTLQLPDADAVAELRLIDPAGVVVAVARVAAEEAFNLDALPKVSGPLTYRLQTWLGEQRLGDEPVAVYIREEASAQLLVLQSAPSFETRQLANWAADRGSRLLMRSRISRDREQVRGVNLPDTATLRADAAFLAATDLAVIDGRRWASMDAAARQQLLTAVREGLCLLLLMDEALADWLEAPDAQAQLGIAVEPVPESEPLWPQWPGVDVSQPLPVAPWRIQPRAARPLTVDTEGVLLETWIDHGRGRIAVSRLRERHRWATLGEESLFSLYWSRLLRHLGRPETASRWDTPAPDLRLRAGERAALCARGDTPMQFDYQPLEGGQTTRLALQAHGWGGPLYCGHVWADRPGWYRLRLLSTDGLALDEVMLRVFDDVEWMVAELAGRQRATAARTLGRQSAIEPRRVPQPLSPWWAWMLLLLSAVPLWLERRLYDQQ